MKKVTEGKSKYLTESERILKEAEHLYGISGYIIGAAGGGEIKKMVANAVEAAKYLTYFATSLLRDDADFASPELSKEIKDLKDSITKLQIWECKGDKSLKNISESVDGVYVDPYESEYLPVDMRTSIKEDSDNTLPEDLDDDPDALFTTDVDGMPQKFNAVPIELDPFAVKLFRNNAELVDPPEVRDLVKDAGITTEPEIEPGEATTAEVNDAGVDQVIDVIADAPVEDEEDKDGISDDFDVFANESRKIPQVRVTPKETPVLPPKFSETEARIANENIANDTGNNLKMLSFLMTDW